MPPDTDQGTMPDPGRDTSLDDSQGVMPADDQGTMPDGHQDDALVDPSRSNDDGKSSAYPGSADDGDLSPSGPSGSAGDSGTEAGSTGSGDSNLDSTMVDPGAIMGSPDLTSLGREMHTDLGVTMGGADENGMKSSSGVDMQNTDSTAEMQTNPGTGMTTTPRSGSPM